MVGFVTAVYGIGNEKNTWRLFMTFQTKNCFFRWVRRYVGPEKKKKCLLKTVSSLAFFGFALLSEAYGSDYRNKENSFHALRKNFKTLSLGPCLQEIEQERIREYQQKQKEYQHAKMVVEGVVSMYWEDARFGDVKCTINTTDYVNEVNASYSYTNGAFNLPRVRQMNGGFYSTALDQGIVSHEAGHMVLHYLINMINTSHTRAFHEAFADLTSHFYRFYNRVTRCEFFERLNNGEGCVGDTNFTCVRNNHQTLSLNHIAQNKKLLCEEHQFSRPLSNAIYDNMVTAYGNLSWLFSRETDAENIVTWHKRMLVHAVLSLNSSSPTIMDVAKQMLIVSYSDSLYRDGLGRNFINNGLIVLVYQSPKNYYTQNQKFRQLCQ